MSILDTLHGMAIRAAFQMWYGRKPYGRYTTELEQTQWWSWDKIQSLQMRKLEALIRYAYENVPFYRRRFDEVDLHPRDIQAPDDLIRLPVLTKRDIQNHLHELLAKDVNKRRWTENHTGGSTGHPLTFYQDANYWAWANADLLRNYRMAGYQLGMRWAFLWGSDYDAQAHRGWFGHLKNRIIYNVLWINTFDLSVSTLTWHIEQLIRFQPHILIAYVSSATLLARMIREQDVKEIKPRAIQTSAEVLTCNDRHFLEETFGCSIFDRYGCREVSNIAHECEKHTGLHILAENNLVEFIKKDGQPARPGEEGHIIVTNLNNYAMPFIRYDIGDVGIPSNRISCPCGRGLPLMETIKGRTTDIFISPSGKLLHGEFFTHLFYKTQGIYQFQVIQETSADIVIKIVPETQFNKDKTFQFLEKTIHDYGDPNFQIHFELCDQIPTSVSGKFRFTISKLPD